MRSMIIKTLRLSGIPLGDVLQAANGAEALEVLDQSWVDLALVDINMPIMDGEEMIDRVRENPTTADLPVVVISTESSETRIELLQRKGAGFVHKPFTPEMLREKIINITGVSDDITLSGEGAVQGGGCDF
jgi:two-component system chemotaxis response regulator CheY